MQMHRQRELRQNKRCNCTAVLLFDIRLSASCFTFSWTSFMQLFPSQTSFPGGHYLHLLHFCIALGVVDVCKACLTFTVKARFCVTISTIPTSLPLTWCNRRFVTQNRLESYPLRNSVQWCSLLEMNVDEQVFYMCSLWGILKQLKQPLLLLLSFFFPASYSFLFCSSKLFFSLFCLLSFFSACNKSACFTSLVRRETKCTPCPLTRRLPPERTLEVMIPLQTPQEITALLPTDIVPHIPSSPRTHPPP